MGGGLVESQVRAGADAQGLRLIETFALGSPRLGLHRARMERGAAALGWSFDGGAFERAVMQADPDRGARLRLTLGAAGVFDVEQSALVSRPAPWRLALAATPLYSLDPWLAIKTTNRALYDAAGAAMPLGIDEVVFQNERGEVCDGTITTLFFDRGQGMRTPPLTCGVLPGVLRAEIGCAEQVLLARDLPDVRLWVGNSLRGLMPAVWVGDAV
jgi:4-amino-4-deoxychorismate lyase